MVNKRQHRQINFSLYKALLFLSILLLLPAFGFTAEKSYIVGFHNPPGKAGKERIKKSRGRIKRSFNLINAMSVTLSEDEAQLLKKDTTISYITEDKIYTATEPQPGQEYGESWGIDHISADLAHLSGNKGAGVKIAVIDTGIDYFHEDLNDNYAGGYDFVFDDNDPYDDNTNSHGTHVAGIIAAEDNGIGVIGVAPEASLFAVKVLDGGGFGLLSWIISGIEWAVNNNVDIINLSIQGPGDPALEAACNNAYDAGVIIIAAGGNTNGGSVTYPAAYASVVAVTSTDTFDLPAYFSPIGPEIDVAAPGLNIQSTTAGDTYDVLSGTSHAAPHITGIAALYLAAGVPDQNNDGFVNNETIHRIKKYALDLGDPDFDNIYGFGLANAAPCPDNDKDSYAICDAFCNPGLLNCNDCNDSDASAYPGATEICDTIDNNCDSQIDESFSETCLPVCLDNDADGYASCDIPCQQKIITVCGNSFLQPCGDCNDNDASIKPCAIELCDGVDNDCNDIIDTDNETCLPVCLDNDADGYASCDIPCQQKIITACGSSSLQPCGDCNDNDASINPDAIELCDAIDNDCDGYEDSICNPPIVRQVLGVMDINYNTLTEADCRLCHGNPDQFPENDVTMLDRHHLFYGRIIPDPTASPFGTPGDTYQCLDCHAEDTFGDDTNFIVERDCVVCHVLETSETSVHHQSDHAQGTLPQGPDCQYCHGSIVDNIEDGHFISSEPVTDSTPKRSNGTGLPLNSFGNGSGSCVYCHDSGTTDEGIYIESNLSSHHETGFGYDETKCAWCHDFGLPFDEQIRPCENCHGRDSIHSIQSDSDDDGIINPGIEQRNYGHIGNTDDCWGCHGYGASNLPPVSGPTLPVIYSVNHSILKEETATELILTGIGFTNQNLLGGETHSEIMLVSMEGTTLTIIPESITQTSITVTVPGTLMPGNYTLTAVKTNKHSNAKTISIIPNVSITSASCTNGTITLTGSGFFESPPESAHEFVYVKENGIILDCVSWTDTEIQVSGAACSGEIKINSLFGSDTWQQ